MATYTITYTGLTNINVVDPNPRPTSIETGASITLRLEAVGNYSLPQSASAITVSGATGVYAPESTLSGTLTISNPTANVSITGAAVCSISYNLSNILVYKSDMQPAPTEIALNGTVNLKFVQIPSYIMPTQVSVVNATYVYTRTSDSEATLALSAPQGNIVIVAAGVEETTYSLTITPTDVTIQLIELNGATISTIPLPSSIKNTDEMKIYFTANTGKALPPDVSVTGATSTYSINGVTGKVTIKGAYQTVAVGITGSLPYISQVQLPNTNVYLIKDTWAREQIKVLSTGGVSFYRCTCDEDTPLGVTWSSGGITYHGTLLPDAAQPNYIYLVPAPRIYASQDVYYEYVTIKDLQNHRVWEKLGSTAVDFSSLGDLAWKNNVVLNKGSGVSVLKDNASLTVNFGTPGSDTFVKSYPGTTSKLATTTITGCGENTTLSYSATSATNVLDSSTVNGAETLVLTSKSVTSSTSTVATKASSSTTVATGSLNANASGATVMTGLGTANTSSALTSLPTATASTTDATYKVLVPDQNDLSISVT